MKVFLAGGTGAMGKRLIPQLVAHGHSVAATTRSQGKVGEIWNLGGKPVVLDPLDRLAVMRAVTKEQPDVVVHQLTALAGVDFRRFEKSFAMTNRLRTDATDYLVAAAAEAGVPRLVAQSYAGWPSTRDGVGLASEVDPFDSEPAPQMRATLDALQHLEAVVLGADGIVLRYGGFYGPGTGIEPGGDQVAAVRKRQFPLVGQARGVWSFVHIDDAATATVAAIEHGAPGVYNVVDDDPAPVNEWLPYLAELAGAKPPRRLPLWLGRMVGGEHMVVLMDQVRGVSNAKAKRELRWQPAYASWRDGFAAVLRPQAGGRQSQGIADARAAGGDALVA